MGIIKNSVFFVFLLYVFCVAFIYSHELDNQKVFTKYGMESYITMTDFGLHGHTYPKNFDCGEQPEICKKIASEIW